MKKANELMNFLETVHPLKAEVYHDQPSDIKVYKTSHSFDDREGRTAGQPLGDTSNRDAFFKRCCEWLKRKSVPTTQEYLFYSVEFEQGMVMAYRPDYLREGKWCLVIITILPPMRKRPKPETELVMVEKLYRRSQLPTLALQYVLDIAEVDTRAYNVWCDIKEGKYNYYDLKGVLPDCNIYVSVCNEGIENIGTDKTLKSLKLVEV